MHTYEMIGVADENGRTYVSDYGSYSKEKGFDLLQSCHFITTESLLNILLHEDCWKLAAEPKKKITVKEIEEKFGCPVEIVDYGIYRGFSDFFTTI
jgi:hypothetical protein